MALSHDLRRLSTFFREPPAGWEAPAATAASPATSQPGELKRLPAEPTAPSVSAKAEQAEPRYWENGRSFVAMELIEGASLRQLLRRHRSLPPGPALDILQQVCQALDHAHQQATQGDGVGIVHRDVKPGNVLVDGWGRVKLVDFGIATAMSGAGDTDGPGWGTPGYAAPEQLRGLKFAQDAAYVPPYDKEVDLWSVRACSGTE